VPFTSNDSQSYAPTVVTLHTEVSDPPSGVGSQRQMNESVVNETPLIRFADASYQRDPTRNHSMPYEPSVRGVATVRHANDRPDTNAYDSNAATRASSDDKRDGTVSNDSIVAFNRDTDPDSTRNDPELTAGATSTAPSAARDSEAATAGRDHARDTSSKPHAHRHRGRGGVARGLTGPWRNTWVAGAVGEGMAWGAMVGGNP